MDTRRRLEVGEGIARDLVDISIVRARRAQGEVQVVGLGDPRACQGPCGLAHPWWQHPCKKDQTVCPVLRSMACTYSGTGTYTLIKETGGSKREARRDGRRETRDEIRQCLRAKPAEGRGMTEPWEQGSVDHIPWELQLAANPGAESRVHLVHLAPASAPAPVPSPEVHRHPARPRTVGLPSRKVFWDKADAGRAFCNWYVPAVPRRACLMEGWPAI